MEWSPDGRQLASGANDNLIHIWDGDQATPRHVLREHTSAVKALAWCPWKPALLASGGGSQDKHIKSWNTITGDRLSSVNAECPVSALVWSKTSRELVSSHCQPSNHIRFWKQQPSSTSPCHLSKAADIGPAHDSRILHMCLSPDGQTLVTAGGDESIKFWRAFEGKDEMEAGKAAKRKPGLGGDGKAGYVLMPTFSRSSAVTRAVNAANIAR